MMMFSNKDPFRGIKWQLWVKDRFDSECPRRVEKEGRGLLLGLKTLWIFHLVEGMTPEGRESFTKFNLWCGELDRSFDISGSRSGLVKIHQWLNRNQENIPLKKYSLNKKLLKKISEGHYQLILRGDSAAKILEAAETAADLESFIKTLTIITK